MESRRYVFSRVKRVLIHCPFGRDVEQGCENSVADAALLREEAFTHRMLRSSLDITLKWTGITPYSRLNGRELASQAESSEKSMTWRSVAMAFIRLFPPHDHSPCCHCGTVNNIERPFLLEECNCCWLPHGFL
jgi:hypothetical protein